LKRSPTFIPDEIIWSKMANNFVLVHEMQIYDIF